MQTILILFGGCSSEHDVSLHSAAAVMRALEHRYALLPVGITRSGRWLRYTGTADAVESGCWDSRPGCAPCTLSLDRGERRLILLDGSGRSETFDAAFPVLHGKNGEDGTVQGLLELVGAPMIGCGVLSSALCMDKDRAHRLAAAAGIAVPRGAVFTRLSERGEIESSAASLGWPVFVKPVRAGSSFGISRVDGPDGLGGAVREAFRHDREVLIEEAVPGFEVGCAVMGCGELTAGAVDEIELSRGFFDYEEKYGLITSRIHCPARIPPEKAEEIKAAARVIYRTLDCRVFARVDMFLTPDGRIVFNEVNTIPGFTSHSRYPGMMAAAGMDFETLVQRLVELGVSGR